MSTKQSIINERDVGQGGFLLYDECFDFEREFVYLAFTGIEPKAWAGKHGLLQPDSPTENTNAA